jgi:hypothetical protein
MGSVALDVNMAGLPGLRPNQSELPVFKLSRGNASTCLCHGSTFPDGFSLS